MNGVNCSGVSISVAHTELKCTLAAGKLIPFLLRYAVLIACVNPGVGLSLPVVIRRGSQSSTASVTVSYQRMFRSRCHLLFS